MLLIENVNIREDTNLLNINLNYPFIKLKSHNERIINNINKLIYEDVMAFKDVMVNDISHDIYSIKKCKHHAIVESNIHLNKNYIMSIAIIFSQLIGLYDTSYINTYNYDLILEKKLCLDDIFDKNTNYLEKINDYINHRIKEIIKEYEDDVDQDFYKNISNDENFYIEKDGITICFGSYELSKYIPHLLEFKIQFSNYEKYLTKYTINNIYKYSHID